MLIIDNINIKNNININSHRCKGRQPNTATIEYTRSPKKTALHIVQWIAKTKQSNNDIKVGLEGLGTKCY